MPTPGTDDFGTRRGSSRIDGAKAAVRGLRRKRRGSATVISRHRSSGRRLLSVLALVEAGPR
jgi:hypothetical protein